VLLGYEITAAVYASLILMLVSLFLERKELIKLVREHTDRFSLIALALILIFFIAFSLLFVSPVEQLYFDENIYQGIAINMLKNGNALWCQYGTGDLTHCYVNSLYHDPVGWSAFIAIAFGIFGIGIRTSYNLELLAGAASVVFIFLVSSLLVKRKGFAVLTTLALAMMPQLFIWSRTQADLDLPMMMFAELSFFLFLVFMKRKSIYSLAAFVFSVDLLSYMRIEAMLLVGVFAVLFVAFGDSGIATTVRERIGELRRSIESNTAVLSVLLIFIILLVPQIYYITIEAQNPAYGQGLNQSVVSLANFKININTNLPFLFGQINGINMYPTAFHYTITSLAILGGVLLAFDKKIRNRFGILLLILLWFLSYFIFYTAFYAGSATYGVDSRFMLQLLPAVCMLAAFAVLRVSDFASWMALNESERSQLLVFGLCWLIAGILSVSFGVRVMASYYRSMQYTQSPKNDFIYSGLLLGVGACFAYAGLLSLFSGFGIIVRKYSKKINIGKGAFIFTMAISSLALIVYPFTLLIPAVAIAPSAMPQQSVILKAINTFYSEYNDVPQNCLVFSFTPDIWFEVNRSSAQIDYLTGANSTLESSIRKYSCVVLDYGYWCVVPPYHGSVCRNAVNEFRIENLTSPAPPLGGDEVTFYRILNYS
jgi:hypothetical protein